MLKKIPYVLLLLVVYIVLAYSGMMTVLSGSAVEAANTWDRIGRVANYITALGPIVLMVLVIVQSIKPVVGQVGGVVCLLLAVAYGYRGFQCYISMNEYLEMAENVDAQVIYFIETFLTSIVFALLFWLVGAKIQDEEVTGLYSAVAGLGMFLTVILALSGASAGVVPVNVIPMVLLMYTAKKIPAVFVPGVTPIGIRVKHIVILAIIAAAYYILPTALV